MSTLTNQLALPEPLVDAIRNDAYDRGDCDYTTTQLLRPVRINVLLGRHGGEITEDAADRIFALFGQAIHTILERAASERYIVEERYYMEIDGTRIGGRIDVFDKETRTLSDYKLCSRYVTADGVKPEWEQQDNINALLMRENGIQVDAMTIVAIFRDWSLMMASRKDDYPQRQVVVMPVPAWPQDKTVAFIRERIKAHKEGAENPPVCTPEERWARPTEWALQKKGQKRAVKLFETQAQANAAADWDNGLLPNPKFYVEERPGVDVRCKYYCPVWKYCDFGKLVHDNVN